MFRPIIAIVVVLMTLNAASFGAQQSVSFKNFNSFKQAVPGVDFFASSREEVAPYEKPVADVLSRLKTVLGGNLPEGAIFICSTLAQKDSVYEPAVLRAGYGWTLSDVTSKARMEEQLARLKAQMGTEISPELLDRFKSRMSDAASQTAVNSLVQQVAYAVLQTSMNKELQYRSSRVEDVGKSPLPDWLDIGIVSYATGAVSNLSFLQQNIEDTFPIDDVLIMSRPFVGSIAAEQGGGGGMGRGGGGNPGGNLEGMRGGGFGGMPAGGFGGIADSGTSGGAFGGRGGAASGGGRGEGSSGQGRGQRGGQQRNLPKDEQDRMLFDGQASSFFAYLVEKIGIEKVKTLIRVVQEEKSSRDYLTQADVFGSGYSKVEDDWIAWVKAQKAPSGSRTPGMF